MTDAQSQRQGQATGETVGLQAGGDRLTCTLFRPKGIPCGAATIICHGAHGDSSQFLEMAACLADQGQVVLLPDMHGHGRSGGARYHVRISQWVGDVQACLDWLERQPFVDPARIGALGFSSGGTAVIEAALIDSRLKTLVALDATVRPVLSRLETALFLLLSRFGAWKERLTGRQLHLPLYPIARFARVACDRGVNRQVLSDPELRRAYWRYPLPGALESLVVNTLDRVDRLTIPVCVIHGECDALDPPDSARALFERLGGEKALHLIPESGHMGHLDTARQTIFDLACEWFSAHL